MYIYFHALATDYDGTLARDGAVGDSTVAALKKLRESGRKLILVTGRVIKDLLAACPFTNLFDCIVGENGALLYWPATRESQRLREPLPATFIQELRRREISPLVIGEVLAATQEPNQTEVLAAIREQGLELEVIFNKGAVMILPSGVNKGTGLQLGLQRLGLSRHNIVGIGDAENDHVFLELCECSAAVANAIPSLKERSDLCLSSPDGAGVNELIDSLVADDLASHRALPRHQISLGTDSEGQTIAIPPRDVSVLFCGPSGSGKSTLATAVLEGLRDRDYQFCLIDPEGDYEQFRGAVKFGRPDCEPDVNEAVAALTDPSQNVIVNMMGVPLDDRPMFLSRLYPMIEKLRRDTGRPHWLFIDEAHHMMPAGEPAVFPLAAPTDSVMVTVEPAAIHRDILKSIDVIVATENRLITDFCRAVGQSVPQTRTMQRQDETVVWFRSQNSAPITLKNPMRGSTSRLRHRRKYAEGELPRDRSFYFTGAEHRLNLRADNLQRFIQLAEGVDDETWEYHLRRHDYSRWIREALSDRLLADQVRQIEDAAGTESTRSRRLIKATIEKRYTSPA